MTSLLILKIKSGAVSTITERLLTQQAPLTQPSLILQRRSG